MTNKKNLMIIQTMMIVVY